MKTEEIINKEKIGIFNKILAFVISLFIAIGGYYLKETGNQIKEMNQKISKLQLFEAKTESSRFSYTDWQTEKQLIELNKLNTEKRLVMLEANFNTIKDDIKEIKDIVKNSNR